MNEKQRRLIEYFGRLTEPVAPPPPAAGAGVEVEEAAAPLPGPVVPPRVSPDSVRQMLEGRTDRGGEAVEESLLVPAEGPLPPSPEQLPLPEETIELAVSAARKALEAAELTPEEQEVLEAIVIPGKRPVLDVTGGRVSAPPPGWEFLSDHGEQIEQVLPSVGRIDVPELLTVPYAGTGFFVGDGILMTNRHVARLFVEGVGLGQKFLRFRVEQAPLFDPQYEVGDPDPGAGTDRFEVVEPLLVHPHWDAALLRVRPVGDAVLPPALKLARQAPSGLGGGAMLNVVVLGYPTLDERNDIAEQMSIFRQIFGRKRLMPGYLTGFRDVTTKWKATLHATTHDASTLGGNSGSAVVDLASGLVLALHFGGRYLDANFAVPAWELAQDDRVTDLGLDFADFPSEGGPSPAGKPVWLSAWNGLPPLATEEVPAAGSLPTPVPAPGGGTGPAAEGPVLPVAPDWFERVSDNDLVEAMRRDPARTERLIRETLLPEEADDLIADLKRGLAPAETGTAEEGVFDFLLGTPTADPALPEIVFLHGILGGHLTAHGGLGGRVWLSPLAFVAGGVARRLALADDGERDRLAAQILYPDGHVRLVYEKAARKWRMRGFIVHEFTFDWRKPLANAADRLHLFIESLRLERPMKKFALVGHSMGGLVAALYAARHPEWSTRVAQAILLGSPLRGSYAPVEALLGTYPVFPKAALADLKDDLGDYMAMARTLPGLIDMLPDPDLFPDAAPLYQRATWPTASAPAQLWLDQSRQVKRLLAGSPILETAHLIVSNTHPTVAEVAVVGGQLRPGPANRPGDGTVPTRSAAGGIPARAVYRARHGHADLPREGAVIEAVMDLLVDGKCDLTRLSQQAIDDDAPIEEAIVGAMEEGVSESLSLRLRAGIFTQRDADFLLRPDHATLPGTVGLAAGGGA